MSEKIVLSEMAYYDIETIFSYISQDNKQAAEKLRVQIYEGIKKLSSFPEMGAVIPEEDAPGTQRGYRRIVVSPYSILYKVVEDIQKETVPLLIDSLNQPEWNHEKYYGNERIRAALLNVWYVMVFIIGAFSLLMIHWKH